MNTALSARHLSFVLLLAAGLPAQKLSWHDARSLSVEGQGFIDTEAPYDRLPARAEAKVRKAVWRLSRHSAGIAVRFVSDASQLHARWSLTSSRLAMPHMAATGVSSLDLYARDSQGRWRWLACPKATKQKMQARLIAGLPKAKREYLLYLPLYNGVHTLELAVPTGSILTKAPPRPKARRKPIVFYGTSITHGACASRPGMAYPAILGRRFDRPVINLGFSGNGRMELEVAEFLSEIDAAVFVIDCLPNMNAKQVEARTGPLVERLRKAHPKTPILLVEDRNFQDAWLVPSKRKRNESNQAALRKQFKRLQAAGVRKLHYLPAAEQLGHDGDGSVDSSHPNDLGFWRQAGAFEKQLRTLLPSR
ncbi:MAG: hypothetical protein CSA62_09150 [Planctomycetota bacterium]|nr:MAG: hypothetical protein CSA62_09150 [Planctomycetota bacterium]